MTRVPVLAHKGSGLSWIFFAIDAKPTSMRRAVAECLAATEPVVIVSRPVSVVREPGLLALKHRVRRAPKPSACLYYRPLHLPEAFPGLQKMCRNLNLGLLRKELGWLLPEKTGRVICYDSPTQDHLVKRLGEDMSIYLAIDDRTLTVWGEPIKGELEAERRLLSRVDAVVCVSDVLSETIKSRTPQGRTMRVQTLSNGFDERLFDPVRDHTAPAVLATIKKPRVLVAGHVSERVDWDGIMKTVRIRPQWTWVFVGPADSGMPEKIRQLSAEVSSARDSGQSPNLIWQHEAPLETIPALMAHSDACAVPYRLNKFTLASSPLKAIESLAMGTPVLSTSVPSLEKYRDAIEWVEEGSGESYSRALDRISAEKGDRMRRLARRAAVSGDSWATRARQFRQMVLSVHDQAPTKDACCSPSEATLETVRAFTIGGSARCGRNANRPNLVPWRD
jgi:glycosyltransferase involved in cell wall biosynthesis